HLNYPPVDLRADRDFFIRKQRPHGLHVTLQLFDHYRSRLDGNRRGILLGLYRGLPRTAGKHAETQGQREGSFKDWTHHQIQSTAFETGSPIAPVDPAPPAWAAPASSRASVSAHPRPPAP